MLTLIESLFGQAPRSVFLLSCGELHFPDLGDIGNRSSWLGFMLTRFPSWLKTHPPLHDALSNNAI
jgi:hypothetical protein